VKHKRPRKPVTPACQIRSALRRLFLRSRERAAVLKRDGYTCRACGTKQSRSKGREVYVEVHHLAGIENWPELIEAVRRYLLCGPDDMLCLCNECHKAQEPHDTALAGEEGK
jgi:predicted HNH restriction endonuclease